LEARLKSFVGVIETGLFLGLASAVIVGRPTGVEVIER
jgi:ribose 5-phosphate isomerase A